MDELYLKEIFNMFWKRKIAFIVILIVTIVIGILYSYFVEEPKYTSYTTALLINTYFKNGESVTETNLESLVPTYIEIIKSNVVKREIIEELNVEGLDVGSIEAKQIEGTEMVKITVINSNSEHAAKVANKLVEVANNKIKEFYEIDNIYVIDEAEVNTTSSNINHKKDILIFTFIGIVVACGYVLLMNIIKP